VTDEPIIRAPSGDPSTQPLASVEWVDPRTLRANDYNPNKVARPELALLRLSLLENGWTQPIVARRDGEIVDGFHRWTLGTTDPDVAALAGGLVPVVRLADIDPATQRMATIRHNRARGSHAVIRMADIVNDLAAMGVSRPDIAHRLGMDDEEVDRLMDHGRMTKRGTLGATGFSKGWTTADPADVTDEQRGEPGRPRTVRGGTR
jgi:ParB-like chromosome segregation protein Spo0J